MTRLSATSATELEYEQTILDVARLAGYRRHGERPARSKKGYRTPIKGEAGWPDLVLAKRGQLVIAELKVATKPTVDQIAWLEALDNRPHVVALVLWLPEQMDRFNERLFDKVFTWEPYALTLRRRP